MMEPASVGIWGYCCEQLGENGAGKSRPEIYRMQTQISDTGKAIILGVRDVGEAAGGY